jgi:alanine racemase
MRFAGSDAAWAELSEGRPMKWAEIDVGALRDNAAALRRHTGEAVQHIAMVKANGYGHGAVLAARAFVDAGASWLGVSSAEEALQLRDAGLGQPVLAVAWTHPSTHATLLRRGVDVTVWDSSAVDSLRQAAGEGPGGARIHVKVNTGMNRIGVTVDGLPALLRLIAGSRQLCLAGIFTHFADADGVDDGFTEAQHEAFLDAIAMAKDVNPEVLVHCANSAALLRHPHMHHDAVRPGIALYGYAPPGAAGIAQVRPAMSVLACVTQVKTVHRGDAVGYGRTWTASRDTRVATVAAGYADGVQRAQSNRGHALVRGVRCPMIGRVSMDQTTIDVSELDDVAAGEPVTLLGGQNGTALGADDVAAAAGTIAHEVLCGVSARVPRVVVNRP